MYRKFRDTELVDGEAKPRYAVTKNGVAVGELADVNIELISPTRVEGDLWGAKAANKLLRVADNGDLAAVVERFDHTRNAEGIHLLTGAVMGDSLQQINFVATADYTEDDRWRVGDSDYTAKQQGAEGALYDKYFVVGDLVSVLLDPVAKKLGFRSGGKPPVPSIFGDGSDGDLVVLAGQTVVLPVLVPHQSVVERNYSSVLIEAGGVLKCSDPNAGLVLRCNGDCTINGTIDQSLMAPKSNPNNTYIYPAGLTTGAGGNGGKGGGVGGAAMGARAYGGGYGAGGGGGDYSWSPIYGGSGGGAAGAAGTNTSGVTVNIPTEQLFVLFGNGGKGGSGGNGGTGAGASGANSSGWGGGGGGAGHYGGGVIIIYAYGKCTLAGSLLCNGGNGGKGGNGVSGESANNNNYGGNGGGGGGGGGGALYIVHGSGVANTAICNVNGGTGGTASAGAVAGTAGGVGTITIKKYEKGMTA